MRMRRLSPPRCSISMRTTGQFAANREALGPFHDHDARLDFAEHVFERESFQFVLAFDAIEIHVINFQRFLGLASAFAGSLRFPLRSKT